MSGESACSRAVATPRSRLEPAVLATTRAPEASSAARINRAVVVLPLVPDSRITPSGIAAAISAVAAGRIRLSSRPGSVVPPPRRNSRDRRPAQRATVAANQWGSGGCAISRPSMNSTQRICAVNGWIGHWGPSLRAGSQSNLSARRRPGADPRRPGADPASPQAECVELALGYFLRADNPREEFEHAGRAHGDGKRRAALPVP